jgi:hypothetical protein
MRSLVIALLLVFTHLTAYTQQLSLSIDEVMNVAQLLPDEVEVVGSSQGMAIWRRYAFLMHDKGQCVILDMNKKSVVATYTLEGNTGHCNNASFGVERYSKQSVFPLLYVAECRGERACYVNDISFTGSRLVQKIFYDGEDIQGPADWFVDGRNGHIYLYCTIDGERRLKCFPLPRLSDSDARAEVHLNKEDAINELAAGPIAIPQGSHKHGKTIYLADGIPPRATRLHIKHLRNSAKSSIIELSHTGLEPEGMAVRGRWLYISFHTPRNNRGNIIYRIRR